MYGEEVSRNYVAAGSYPPPSPGSFEWISIEQRMRHKASLGLLVTERD